MTSQLLRDKSTRDKSDLGRGTKKSTRGREELTPERDDTPRANVAH